LSLREEGRRKNKCKTEILVSGAREGEKNVGRVSRYLSSEVKREVKCYLLRSGEKWAMKSLRILSGKKKHDKHEASSS